ncbi:MAG TPA: thiamine pyrophosphate-dependent enzyme [Longimicrobiales bacterium]
MSASCSLLWAGPAEEDQVYDLHDYESLLPRWCPGCGDHSVLTAMQKLAVAEQFVPESTVFVSGIGCSSRFPHYMNAYGFHGIHGRALPVATGVKLTRPELTVFVAMGDGDCTSIGAAHWLHALRYNIDMTAMLLDNSIYGLTKKQTSPTTPQGFKSNTTPRGAFLPALNPVQASLGITNASFVAQTAKWVPAHLYAVLRAAYQHKGFSFVRILQRCPQYMDSLYMEAVRKPSLIELLVHEDGVIAPELDAIYKQQRPHDPHDLDEGRRLAEDTSHIRLGVFFRDENRPRYDDIRRLPTRTVDEKIRLMNTELDRYAV